MAKFLRRFWRYINSWIEVLNSEGYDGKDDPTPLLKVVYRTAKRITDEFETRRFHFNTSVASLMEMLNSLERMEVRPSKEDMLKVLEIAVKLIAPFGPHIAEELWERLGKKPSVFRSGWVKVKEEYLKEDSFTLVVQVDGKVRARLDMPVSMSEEEIKRMALEHPNVNKWLEGKPVQVFYVPGKIVNIVTKRKDKKKAKKG